MWQNIEHEEGEFYTCASCGFVVIYAETTCWDDYWKLSADCEKFLKSMTKEEILRKLTPKEVEEDNSSYDSKNPHNCDKLYTVDDYRYEEDFYDISLPFMLMELQDKEREVQRELEAIKNAKAKFNNPISDLEIE